MCSGSSVNITFAAPAIFDDNSGVTLRRDGKNLANDKCQPITDVTANPVTYQCNNMNTTDSGNYSGHLGFTCGSNVTLEWCTFNVTFTVQSCSIGEP